MTTVFPLIRRNLAIGLVHRTVAEIIALILPFSPLEGWLGFQAPGMSTLLILALLVLGYLACAELLKRWAFWLAGSRVEQAQSAGPECALLNRPAAHEVGHVPSGSR